MLEYPSIRRYSFTVTPPSYGEAVSSDNPTGADNQQETVDETGSSETARQAARSERKRQSDLHGDMQSQAEMTWPLELAASQVEE
jgi:hypothetical protein